MTFDLKFKTVIIIKNESLQDIKITKFHQQEGYTAVKVQPYEAQTRKLRTFVQL